MRFALLTALFPPLRLMMTNQILATSTWSSTDSGIHAGVPTWVPMGTYRLGRAASPGLHTHTDVHSLTHSLICAGTHACSHSSTCPLYVRLSLCQPFLYPCGLPQSLIGHFRNLKPLPALDRWRLGSRRGGGCTPCCKHPKCLKNVHASGCSRTSLSTSSAHLSCSGQSGMMAHPNG